MSFSQFAIWAIVVGWVVFWLCVLDYRLAGYLRKRQHFAFLNQFEHVGRERAEKALAARINEEARAAADRIRVAEDIR